MNTDSWVCLSMVMRSHSRAKYRENVPPLVSHDTFQMDVLPVAGQHACWFVDSVPNIANNMKSKRQVTKVPNVTDGHFL